MRLLEVKDLSVHYGAFRALQNVGFSLDAGSWLMLIGPNGAGKSTILKVLTRGVPYTGGVLYEGRDIRKMKPDALARSMGALSQKHYADYAFSVEEVVRLGRYAYAQGALSPPSDEDAAAVQRALTRTGMLSLSKHAVPTLSGGELQRTFFAQLLAQNPRVLLLDEPTNHLDPVYQQQLFALLEEWLHAEAGRAILSVVHDLRLARAYGTDALLLAGGQTLAYGAIQTVFAPENLERAYAMDVYAWMASLQRRWEETGKA